MAKDYYKTLGVDNDASKEEIKKAYKQLAKKFHPDNQDTGNEEKFKEINEAASVLGNQEKRQQYDQFGDADAFKQGGFDFRDMGDVASFDFGDIFDSFFGGNVFGGRRVQRRGVDLRYNLSIELEDAAFGITKDIFISKLTQCNRCHGTGAFTEADVVTCDQCHGSGILKQTRRTPFGIFATTTTCRTCQGSGEMIERECPVCDGEGRIEKEKKIEVNIPKGVHDGNQLRVKNEGQAGEKGSDPGDLYVVINVNEHKHFEREEDDIYVEVPLTFSQATLGDEIEVPTLNGKAKLKIPSGTQPGTLLRMKGKGIPSLRGYHTGDQYVKIKVMVPKKLNKKQKELLKEFDKLNKEKGFLKKLFE